MDSAGPVTVDPLSSMAPDMAAHPQPVYRAMREATPVLAVEGVGVIVSGKAEADEVLRRPDVFSSNVDAVDLKNARPLIPLQIDPPEHKKFRKLLDPLFAPREVARLEGQLTASANELIDAFVDRGEVDFATEFSVPFPTRVFLGLLGLPVEDLPRLLTLKDGIIRPHLVIGETFGSQASLDYQQQTADAIYATFDEMLDQRAVERHDDLLSRFLDATVDGARLSREDILDICFLFLIAGLDTVTASLDCIFAHLATHPEHRRALVEDPSLVPAAVEELLRWETPVMGVVRVAVADTELGGCPVHKDDRVMIMLGSVNTDQADLPDAETVRFDRDVNRHVAFGGGVHRCLGSHLARQELRIAVREWHRRIPEYRVADGHELVYTPAIRSIDHFPMVFTATG